jgi:hypothetical protein
MKFLKALGGSDMELFLHISRLHDRILGASFDKVRLVQRCNFHHV